MMLAPPPNPAFLQAPKKVVEIKTKRMIFLILIKDDFLSEEKDERNLAMIICAPCK
jgi:hypothetical protein